MLDGNEWVTYYWPQVNAPEVCLTEPPQSWSTGRIITDSRGNRMNIDDSVMNAAIRLRAVYHNREKEATIEQQREWDDRADEADVQLECAMIAAGIMAPNEELTLITVDHAARTVKCTMRGPAYERVYTICV